MANDPPVDADGGSTEPPVGWEDRKLDYEKLLEIQVPSAEEHNKTPSRIVWHPFDPNKFLLVLNDIATLVCSTQLPTLKNHGADGRDHAYCSIPVTSDAENSLTKLGFVMSGHTATINDIAFSSKALFAVSGSEDGSVKVWHVSSANQSTKAVPCVGTFFPFGPSDPVTSLFFVKDSTGAEGCDFVACGKGNARISLWSSPLLSSNSFTPEHKQTLTVDVPEDHWLNVIIDDTGEFIGISDTKANNVHVLHVVPESRDAEVDGKRFDYISPFGLLAPVCSWEIANVPILSQEDQDHHDTGAAECEKGFEINLYCVQTTAIQVLKLRPGQCYNEDYVKGRIITRQAPKEIPAELSSIPAEPEPEPEATTSTTTTTTTATTTSATTTIKSPTVDPFSNWLGAIVDIPNPPTQPKPPVATKAPPAVIPIVPPPPHVPESAVLLSPSDLARKVPAADSVAKTSVGKTDVGKTDVAPPGFNTKGHGAVKEKKAQPVVAKKQLPSQKELKITPPVASGLPAGRHGGTVFLDPVAQQVHVLKTALQEMKSKDESNDAVMSQQSLDKLSETVTKQLQASIKSQLSTEMQRVGKAVTRSIKEDGEKTRREAVEGIKAPVSDGIVEVMEKLVVPSIEAGMKEMFSQVNDVMKKGLDKVKEDISNQQNMQTQQFDKILREQAATMKLVKKENDSLKKTIATLTNSIEQLVKHNVGGGGSVNGGGGGSGGGSSSSSGGVVDKTSKEKRAREAAEKEKKAREAKELEERKAYEEKKAAVKKCADAKEYEKAFMVALQAGNVNLCLYCCSMVDLSAVFHTEEGCVVSQTVLLCLLQQIGSAFMLPGKKDFKMESEWLQEVSLNIDASNPSIEKHLPDVKKQLLRHLHDGGRQIADGSNAVVEKRRIQRLIGIINAMGPDIL